MAGSFSMGISPHKILSLLVFIAGYFIEKNNTKKSYSTLKVAKVFFNALYNC
jgi:K+-transporting ATPase A subunit